MRQAIVRISHFPPLSFVLEQALNFFSSFHIREAAAMGKRMRRGGRSPSSSSAVLHREVLRRRIVSLKLDGSFDVDAVVGQLRSHYPEYARIKVQPFSVLVQQTLELLHDGCDDESDDGSSGHGPLASPGPSRKKPNRVDESKKRLLRAEADHIRHRQQRRGQQPDSSDASISTSTSESDEDAVFEATIEPEFDLMKSMLRQNYTKKPSTPAKPGREEDNKEIELSNEKRRAVLGENSKKAESLARGGVLKRDATRFKDIGGMKGVLEELRMEVIVPLRYSEFPRRLGGLPISGILLHGPPGCGKTKLAEAIANEARIPFYRISSTEIVSSASGESEGNIRDLFEKAYRTAPSIVFIDEIDAIASKRETLKCGMEQRIVTQLIICMGESYQALRSAEDSESDVSEKEPQHVLVIGATNRPDALDQALRRPGRFDKEIALSVPDESARLEILTVLLKKVSLEGTFDLSKIARYTPGFVGADLKLLVKKAGSLATKRIMDKRKPEFQGENDDDWFGPPLSPEEIASISIRMSDIEEATKMIPPSSTREGFSSIPSTKWEDVGGLNSLRKEFDQCIIQRIKNPESFEEFGISMAVGILLYGPPGCGKTLIAKAVAHEAGANFIHIKGPEILNKYVGESEHVVRTIFSRARTCSPCIVFFDEVDALTTMRGKDGERVGERVLTQLLIELDGGDQRKGVYVIGATNRLEVMDPAVLRPGRFGRTLYVPVPNAEERGLILKALARSKPIAADVDLVAFGHREECHDLTGADLDALTTQAAMLAREEIYMAEQHSSGQIKPRVIEVSHYEKALLKITPSVSEKQRIYYEAMSKKLNAA